MEDIVTYQSYKEYKAAFDGSMQRASEEFVFIGYMCKQGRDTDILKESGYANVNEFARAEYGIDKTMVSRFVGINDRFSEGGNSPRLKEQYRNFGYSKLGIMLQLPDSINEELSPAFTKAEIQAVKEEYDAEMKKTDLEILMEEKPEGQQDMEDGLSKTVWQLGHDNPELYREIYGAVKETTYEALQEALAPEGEAVYSIGVPGEGRFLLSVKGTDRDISCEHIRTLEKKGYAWEVFHKAVCGIVRPDTKSPEESWEKVYGESFPAVKEPEKPEVAPVQRKKEDKKPKKQPKVIKVKTEKKSVNTQSEEPKTVTEIQKEEEKETEVISTETLQAAEPTGDKAEIIENVTGISEIVTETPLGGAEQDDSGNEEHENGTEMHETAQNGQESAICLPKLQLTREEYRTRRESHISYIKEQMSYMQQDMEDELWNLVKDAMKKGLDRINELIRLDNDHERYLEEEENKADREDDEDADEQ